MSDANLAQALLDALTEQREYFANRAAELKARLAIAEARLAEIEASGKEAAPNPPGPRRSRRPGKGQSNGQRAGA